MSKAEEFEAVCAAWDDACHHSTSNAEMSRAADAVMNIVLQNRRLFARALRRDEVIEDPARDQAAHDVTWKIGQVAKRGAFRDEDDAEMGRAILAAFREIVK